MSVRGDERVVHCTLDRLASGAGGKYACGKGRSYNCVRAAKCKCNAKPKSRA